MSPILSILIPTKNREEYLMDVIKYILSWKAQNFELIIQDNSDNNKLSSLIRPLLNDKRVKYFQIKTWLSVIDNFELAMENSSGKVVTMIGDDDGILEESVALASWMIETGVEAALPQRGVYTWPDLIGSYNSNYYNKKLRIKNNFTSNVQRVDSKNELHKVLRKGGCTLAELPRLYYGLIARDVLNKVRSECGTFFPGPSPDMANASSAAVEVCHFVKLDFPIFISGSCTASTSGMGVQRKHEGDIEKFSHLPKNCKQDWESSLPLFWSGSTIWAESLIKSLKKMKKQERLTEFNYPYLFARCLVFNPTRGKDIALVINRNNMKRKLPLVAYYYISIWGLRAKALLPKIITKLLRKENSSQLVIENKKTISLAIYSLREYLENKNIKLLLP